MKELVKTDFLTFMSDNSMNVTNKEIKNAYENFVAEVLALNQTGSDYDVVFRSLKLTRIEFQSLQTQILYEQGEKCPKISLFTESYFCN
ncbi:MULTISPECIES: hypothetical protein [Dysgonomonas]|uniref:hypothetical protein n=1 Tax=Dysgonomonas TaxID=156973 RepID=UPI000ACD70A0|nr:MULTISPECIES: hypothetical protein [Dysgonomonas]MBN9303550.1 hypothetical protein [Dysgonomonas mossii]